jgi:uncharacterized protein YecA (UPF0149 family)
VGSVKDSTIQNVVNNLVLGRQEDSSLSEQNQKDNKSVSLPVANKEFSSVGRNDPCPCGSGKKFKKCHGK